MNNFNLFFDNNGEDNVIEDDTVEDDAIKKLLQDNLDYLHSIDVKEYTLFRKWDDIQTQKWIPKSINKINEIKSMLWHPTDIIKDLENLKPEIIHVQHPKDQLIWKILRTFTHTGTWKQSPGRLLKFYVRDKITQKYLGIMSFGSDFIGIGGRDNVIGWTTDQKLKKGMLKHTIMGSTISPTQPFGFNYVGGKLIALLCASDVIENVFNSKYDEKLAGITTTSLYGGYSQYTRLNYWKKCKSSDGTITLEPSETIYQQAKNWFKLKYPEEYNNIIKKSHPKSRILSLIYKKLDILTYKNNAPRGVYWCPLYENTNEFLRMEESKLKKKRFDNSVESLTELWKNKYAFKRIKNKPNLAYPLFYDDIINNEWNIVKEKYLKEVGR